MVFRRNRNRRNQTKALEAQIFVDCGRPVQFTGKAINTLGNCPNFANFVEILDVLTSLAKMIATRNRKIRNTSGRYFVHKHSTA